MSAMQKLGPVRFIAAMLASLVLAACGGGGGDGGSGNLISKAVWLNGAQENPAVTTAAWASGSVSVDATTGEVSGTITTFNITGNVAHIHRGAVGVNAPVLVHFTQSSPGVWTPVAGATLTQEQIEGFRNGEMYFNVHTTANPGGEIRGQIGRQIYYATLTGAQEVPPSGSAATGTGTFIYDPETRTLSGSVTTSGITGNVAHIHNAAVGVNAGVLIPATGGPANWTLPATVLTAAQAAELGAGNFYFNVHTTAFPGGEIRGQLYLPIRITTLNGAQETPPNNSGARGTGVLFVNPFTKAIAGRVDFSGFVSTNAHIHRGAPGVQGGVVIPMANPSPTVWDLPAGTTISDELLAALLKGELYYNVHSAAFPAGEIRGQLVDSGQPR